MQFPLKLTFKKIALAPQISVTDANDQLLFYVRQKILKLREAVTVYADREQTRPLYTIQADRIIDFSARYRFRDQNGSELGSVKRQGRKSLWKAHYDIYDAQEQLVAHIQEENAWVKVWDALLGEVPIIGMATGYFFNPTYLVSRPDGTVIVKIKKQPSFFESSFVIEEAVDIEEAAEIRTILSLLMMTLLERMRG